MNDSRLTYVFSQPLIGPVFANYRMEQEINFVQAKEDV